jgi:GT2 family glycosyltransferase
MHNIAVVILNWNGLGFLKQFLKTVVLNTTIPGSAVWVADNGSTDGSAEWVQENWKTVKLIRLSENSGYAGGYAKALGMIEAGYYVLLNSDIEVTTNWLEPMVSFMNNHPETAACQPKILSYTNRSQFEYAGASGGFIDRYGYPFCRGRILSTVEEDTGQYDSAIPVFWASGACLMVRASAYSEAGGLDTSFFAHMEEIDLCWRLNNLGYNIYVIPNSVVYHVGGGTLKYDTPGKSYLNFRNNLYMLYKNLPDSGFHKILFIRKLLDGIAAVMFLLSGRPKHFAAVVRAHLDYYRNGKRLKNYRKSSGSGQIKRMAASTVMLNKSIILLFYMKRIRRFCDIVF